MKTFILAALCCAASALSERNAPEYLRKYERWAEKKMGVNFDKLEIHDFGPPWGFGLRVTEPIEQGEVVLTVPKESVVGPHFTRFCDDRPGTAEFSNFLMFDHEGKDFQEETFLPAMMMFLEQNLLEKCSEKFAPMVSVYKQRAKDMTPPSAWKKSTREMISSTLNAHLPDAFERFLSSEYLTMSLNSKESGIAKLRDLVMVYSDGNDLFRNDFRSFKEWYYVANSMAMVVQGVNNEDHRQMYSTRAVPIYDFINFDTDSPNYLVPDIPHGADTTVAYKYPMSYTLISNQAYKAGDQFFVHRPHLRGDIDAFKKPQAAHKGYNVNVLRLHGMVDIDIESDEEKFREISMNMSSIVAAAGASYERALFANQAVQQMSVEGLSFAVNSTETTLYKLYETSMVMARIISAGEPFDPAAAQFNSVAEDVKAALAMRSVFDNVYISKWGKWTPEELKKIIDLFLDGEESGTEREVITAAFLTYTEKSLVQFWSNVMETTWREIGLPLPFHDVPKDRQQLKDKIEIAESGNIHLLGRSKEEFLAAEKSCVLKKTQHRIKLEKQAKERLEKEQKEQEQEQERQRILAKERALESERLQEAEKAGIADNKAADKATVSTEGSATGFKEAFEL